MVSVLVPWMLAAAAANAPVGADVADVRCIAIFSTVAGDGVPGVKVTAEQKDGLETAIWYFFGKLEGRASGIDVERTLIGVLEPDGAIERLVLEDLPRCEGEAQAKVSVLTGLGAALEALEN